MVWVWVGFGGLAVVGILGALPWVLTNSRRPMNDAARKSAPGMFATLPGGITHYQWQGPVRGPVVVCVHGLTTPSFVWEALAKDLTRMGFRVLCYDLFGRGFSDRPGGAQDSGFFLRQLEDLLADQKIDGGIILMGYSMGGAIATCFAAMHPMMLDRLVLIAPAGLSYRPKRVEEWMCKTPVLGDWLMTVAGGWMQRRAQRNGTRAPVVDDFYVRQRRETRLRGSLPAVLSSQRNMLTEDLSQQHKTMARTDIPVLAIWGEADAVIGLNGLGKLASLNRTARQCEIPDATHAMVYTEPDKVLAALRAFLREV